MNLSYTVTPVLMVGMWQKVLFKRGPSSLLLRRTTMSRLEEEILGTGGDKEEIVPRSPFY